MVSLSYYGQDIFQGGEMVKTVKPVRARKTAAAKTANASAMGSTANTRRVAGKSSVKPGVKITRNAKTANREFLLSPGRSVIGHARIKAAVKAMSHS